MPSPQMGRLFVLKQGANVVAGLRSTSLTVNNQTVEVTSKDDAGWRKLLGGAGVRSISVSGSGIFTDAASEQAVQAQALAGTSAAFDIAFETGKFFSGNFHVTRLEYAGEHNGEVTYNLTLESDGAVTGPVNP